MKFSNFRNLYIFKAIAEEGNVKKTAQKLGIASSNVSAALTNLENEAGATLVKRKRLNLTLTAEGERVLKYANKLFYENTLINQYFDDRYKKNNHIRIVSTYGTVSLLIMQKLKGFFLENKDLTYEITANDLNLDIDSNQADIYIRPYCKKSSDLIQLPFITLCFRLYCSQDYLKETGTPKSKKDLKYHRLIGFKDGSLLGNVNGLLDDGEKNEPGYNKYFVTTNSSVALIEAARENLGIISLSDTTKDLDKIGLVNILPELSSELTLYIVYNQSLKYNDAILRLHKFIEKGEF